MSNIKAVCLMARKLCAKLKFSKCRSKVTHDQNVWYHGKGVVIRNTHAKYESPTSEGKKVITNKKCDRQNFPNVGQRSRSRSRAQNLWYRRKGVVIRNTYAKYESPTFEGKKVISKPKV